MPQEERHLSPAETAKRLGVSQKALRLYERHGLVAPLRTRSGWRVYGAKEIARLHQIVSLKGLGLPLSKIAELLSQRPVSLERLLEAQEQALSAEHGRVNRALGLVKKARARLAAGNALSVDDLIQLTKETTMTTKQQHDEIKAVFDPLVEKTFTKDEIEALKQRAFDQEEASRGWDALMAEAKELMRKGDPTSPEAQNLARRWKAQVALFTQGDPNVAARIRTMWNEAMANPETAPKLPLNPEIFAFVEKAWKARRSQRQSDVRRAGRYRR
ncbi:MAG TPA: MerR family transcriptional regulator [Rhizomicrobium sp.]|nr:MerR family transcriptional regulator [Rhizomicrobium sp.]